MPMLNANFDPHRSSPVQDLLQGDDFYMHQTIRGHTEARRHMHSPQ